MESESNSILKRKRVPKKVKKENGKEVRKRYSTEELTILAQWLADNPLNGDSKGVNNNKETLISYIRRMFMETDMYRNEMTDDSMKNVYKKIIDTYKKAVAWSEETGQGVLHDAGPESFEDAILKICPYFKILHKEYGLLQEHNTSYTVTSGEEYSPATVLMLNENEGEGVLSDCVIEVLNESSPVEDDQSEEGLVVAANRSDESSQPTTSKRSFAESLNKAKKAKTTDNLYNCILEKQHIKLTNEIDLAKIKEDGKKERLMLELASKKELQQMQTDHIQRLLECQERMFKNLSDLLLNKVKKDD